MATDLGSSDPCPPDPTCGVTDGNPEGFFPDGTLPEQRTFKRSALCSIGNTPRLMTGILRQIFLQHFADINQVANSYLRDFLQREGVWSDGVESGLYIEALARWKPEMTEQRPAIVIKEGAWRWQRRGIGDQAGYTWRDGQHYYAGFWQGSHTIFIIGGEAAETQLLSMEVARLLLHYGPVIMDQMELHRFVMLEIGPVSALKEATENYVIPVSVGYVSEETWSLQVDAPRLKRIVFDVDEIIGYAGID